MRASGPGIWLVERVQRRLTQRTLAAPADRELVLELGDGVLRLRDLRLRGGERALRVRRLVLRGVEPRRRPSTERALTVWTIA